MRKPRVKNDEKYLHLQPRWHEVENRPVILTAADLNVVSRVGPGQPVRSPACESHFNRGFILIAALPPFLPNRVCILSSRLVPVALSKK